MAAKRSSMSLLILLEKLKNKFWLIPAACVALLSVLLVGLLHVPDVRPDTFILGMFLHGYSPAGARLILSSISTSLITVIGVLFSLTVVILQQVSSQYSPRVIETFIKSYISQFTLGMFVGTFIFCILLLRQIPGTEGPNKGELPQIAISAALVLALSCIALLVHYIHHIANSIKSTHIIKSQREETIYYLDALNSFMDEHRFDEASLVKPTGSVFKIAANQTGYLRSVDFTELDRLLAGRSVIVDLGVKVGDFVDVGDELARIEGESLDRECSSDLHATFEIGSERTHSQDFRYGIRQLADIALRALSPGINDPSTAIEAVNSIGAVLVHFASLRSLPRVIELPRGTRVIVNLSEMPEIVELGFSQIISVSDQHPPVLLRVKALLDKIKISSRQRVDRIGQLSVVCQERLRKSKDRELFLHFKGAEVAPKASLIHQPGANP